MFQKCVRPFPPIQNQRLGYVVAKCQDISSKGHWHHQCIERVQLYEGVPKIIGMVQAQNLDKFLPEID